MPWRDHFFLIESYQAFGYTGFILFAIYMTIVSILLVNLLIAVFTYESNESVSMEKRNHFFCIQIHFRTCSNRYGSYMEISTIFFGLWILVETCFASTIDYFRAFLASILLSSISMFQIQMVANEIWYIYQSNKIPWYFLSYSFHIESIS